MFHGIGVDPVELPVTPFEDEVQDGAVASEGPVGEGLDDDGTVATVRQPVAGQLRQVVFSGLVEAPVLRDAQGGVVVRLGPVSTSAVLSEATSSTKSGGLPCSKIM